MILSRITKAIREQNWLAVAIEFVIVIAGVLVAFQISAWNELRQEHDRETGYIRDFKADVEADLSEIQQSLFFTRIRIAATNRILELALDEPHTWTLYDSPGFADLPPAPLPDDFRDDALMLAATAFRTIDPANGTWEMLQSTGDVAIMRDRELVSAIQSYRAHLISVVDLEQFARGFLPGIDADRRANGIGLGQAIPRERLIELIQTHPELAAGLRTMRTFALVQYEELIELEAAASSLIENLDNHIQQRR